MTALATALVVALAGFLFLSAAAKAATPRSATAALIAFGVGRRPARAAVGAASALEAAAAAAIVLRPSAGAAQALSVALFGLFGVAGLLGMLSGRAIECGCLGALHRSTLGWQQLVQFALVAATIAIVSRYPPVWELKTGLALLFALVAGTGAVLLAFAARPWARVRSARISLASVATAIRVATRPERTAEVGGGAG
jgi:hypothetical protein